MEEAVLTLDEIKAFCKIDFDDNLLNTMKAAAEEYLLGAGIPQKYDDYVYKLTILTIILYYYDERVSSGAPDSCSDAITQLQLKYKESQNESI